MKKNDKKAFTLIELIAVLVILAIIALIVTPLVLNIKNKAKASAYKRSVDGYGRAVELAISDYYLKNGKKPMNFEELNIEYKGNNVSCQKMLMNYDLTVYLSECRVDNKEVKDSKTDDGFYHYGKYKTEEDVSNLYKAYKIGDEITYNGIKFYVIEDSDSTKDRVTMLKAEPLSVDEVNIYGKGHVNRYTSSSVGTAYDRNGYGGMEYYSSEKCGYVNSTWISTGCTSDYDSSDVKYVIDAWANNVLGDNDLADDDAGYKTRLITYNELLNNLGYDNSFYCSSGCHYTGTMENVPTFVYNSQYYYWTMSVRNDSKSSLWYVGKNGTLYDGQGNDGSAHRLEGTFYDYYNTVRPVVTLYKNAI